MKSYRENPEGEENQQASKQHEREVFALKMQAEQVMPKEYIAAYRLRDDGDYDFVCGFSCEQIGLCTGINPFLIPSIMREQIERDAERVNEQVIFIEFDEPDFPMVYSKPKQIKPNENKT